MRFKTFGSLRTPLLDTCSTTNHFEDFYIESCAWFIFSHRYKFSDQWGMWGQGFYDDVESLTLKYNWVKAQPSGMGIGVFAINYPMGGDDMWQALATFSK